MQTGLGKTFFDEISAYVEIIKSNPFFQVRYKEYRFLPLKIFPFIIVFELKQTEGSVIIWSVFHASQDPKKLPK